MIYVNSKKISSEGTDKFSKEYALGLKAIRKRGFPVIFKINPARITKSETTKGFVDEWNKPYIPYSTTVSGDEGGEHWVYSKTEPNKKDGNLVFKNNGRWMYKKFFSLMLKDIDLIFFLEYKSALIKQGTIYIENKVAEATVKADEISRDIEIRYLIYGENSPLASFPEKLRTLSAAWQVRNALEKNAEGEYLVDLNILKHELFAAVKDGEKRKENGFEAFLNATKAHKLTEKRAIVQQSIDRKLIKYVSKEYKYVFLDKEGLDVGTITRITPQQIGNKVGALNDYLDLHDYDYNLIAKAVKHGSESGGDATIRVEKPTREEIQAMKFPEMVEEAKKCKGVRYTGVKAEALEKSLMDFHEYV